MPPADQAFSALLDDLAERGMLDETLVIWTGEFGRTPQSRPAQQRRRRRARRPRPLARLLHHACWPAAEFAAARCTARPIAMPPIRPRTRVAPVDLVATVYHLLGVPPDLALATISKAGRW